MNLVTNYFQSVNIACKTRSINKDGCSIPLNNPVPNHVIIDMDLYVKHSGSLPTPNSSNCDCVFASDGSGRKDIWQDAWVVPIELKSKKVDASEAIAQLQAGADLIKTLICQNCRFKFMPLLAHGPGIRSTTLRKLEGRFIYFNGKKYPIKRIRCGQIPLAQALAEYNQPSGQKKSKSRRRR